MSHADDEILVTKDRLSRHALFVVFSPILTK